MAQGKRQPRLFRQALREWRKNWNLLPPIASIDEKIMVEREYHTLWFQFAHPHERCVSNRNGSVPIAPKGRLDRLHFRREVKFTPYRSPLHRFEERLGIQTIAPHQEYGFTENRFASKYGAVNPTILIQHPSMVLGSVVK